MGLKWDICGIMYEERLRRLGLHSLNKRRFCIRNANWLIGYWHHPLLYIANIPRLKRSFLKVRTSTERRLSVCDWKRLGVGSPLLSLLQNSTSFKHQLYSTWNQLFSKTHRHALICNQQRILTGTCIPEIPIKPLFHLPFFRLGLSSECGLPNNPRAYSCLTVGNLPTLCQSFSAAATNHKIPLVPTSETWISKFSMMKFIRKFFEECVSTLILYCSPANFSDNKFAKNVAPVSYIDI